MLKIFKLLSFIWELGFWTEKKGKKAKVSFLYLLVFSKKKKRENERIRADEVWLHSGQNFTAQMDGNGRKF